MTIGYRYRYVDLLRGTAAIAVLITHYRWFFCLQPGYWPPASSYALPLARFLWPIYKHGQLAVPMFWVLSGFVFAIHYGSLAESFTYRKFALRRVSRLYPLHLITLLIVAGTQYLSVIWRGHPQVYPNNDLPHFVAQLGLASNWFTMESSFNGPIWSVSVEVLIYCVFALYLARYRLTALPALVIALCFVAIERVTYNTIAWCGALFFIGVLVAMAGGVLHRVAGRSSIAIALAACAIVIAAVVGFAWTGHGGHEDVLLAYFLMPCLILFASSVDRLGVRFPTALAWIGDSTYAIYLCHMPIIILAKTVAPQWFSNRQFLENPAVLIGYVGLVLAVAYPVYVFVEKPAQDLLRKRGARRDRVAHPAVEVRREGNLPSIETPQY